MSDREFSVRVYCGWQGQISLLRQSPQRSGVWGNCRFYIDSESPEEPPQKSDYVVVFNGVLESRTFTSSEGGLWVLSGEPPTEYNNHFAESYPLYDQVLSQDPSADGTLTHGALPWHIGRSYDELLNLPNNREQKSDTVCTVTSMLDYLPGHRDRMFLLDSLEQLQAPIEVYGRGRAPLPHDDKFEVLYPRKYSIAIENSYYDHYWTEKIADCFLSWTMPIYAGAPNITDYFPAESMILIDPKRPRDAWEKIQRAISDNAWEKNLAAIELAREKILNEYQLFPFITNLIKQHQMSGNGSTTYKETHLKSRGSPGVFRNIFEKITKICLVR